MFVYMASETPAEINEAEDDDLLLGLTPEDWSQVIKAMFASGIVLFWVMIILWVL